jgi:hypothetical protein
MMSSRGLSWPAATILIICSACSVSSYALNPTGRYLVEMSRLIRDPQLQRSSMNSVAAPLRPEETEPDVMMEEDEYDDEDIYPFSAQLRSSSVFEGTMPSQARRKMLEIAMESIDDSSDGAGYDLFDALDRHLRALDEQIETSSSISTALDEELSSVEMEYDAEESEEDMISYARVDPAFFEEPSEFDIQSFESSSDEECQTQSAFTYNQGFADGNLSSDTSEGDSKLNSNAGVLIQADPSDYDESAYDAPKSIDFDAQTRNNPHIIGVDSFGFSTIHAQATHSFENYQPKKVRAIQHVTGPPPLPDTIDPYELLGFSRHNPPKDADDVRRAYVKLAKKYHPDAIHPKSNDEEREMATRNFKRINDAYRKLKDDKFRMQEEFFATTMGGAMYEPRGSSRHIRRPFSYGGGFNESGSTFAGSYSARHGARYGERKKFWEKRKASDDYQRGERKPSTGREQRNPFSRRQVGSSCHVSGDQFPPFFSH